MTKLDKFITSSCSRKAKIKNENVARDKAYKYGLEYYYCPICNTFHLTRKKRGKEWVKEVLNK